MRTGTYILSLAPFHLIVCNRPLEFQSSSGLFSLVGKCLQTWEEDRDNRKSVSAAVMERDAPGFWGFFSRHHSWQDVHFERKWLPYLSAMVCCSLMPTLKSTGNTRRGFPSLISSGKIWKTSRGNGTWTVNWSLNVERWQMRRLQHVWPSPGSCAT